jgi:hypothetical protein
VEPHTWQKVRASAFSAPHTAQVLVGPPCAPATTLPTTGSGDFGFSGSATEVPTSVRPHLPQNASSAGFKVPHDGQLSFMASLASGQGSRL